MPSDLTAAFLPLTRPDLDERDADAASRVILSGWLTQGVEVAAFEEEFAEAVGARHACAVASGTAALHLALLAAGVSAGDEVVTVSHSFVATASAIRYTGAMPVFVDIAEGTFNVDPERVEEAITPRARALLVVHQLGMPCALERLVGIARRHGLTLIEDAACAAGSEILWRGEWERIGRPHGDVACFSFHPRKVLTTGEGGMLTTNRTDWDARFRLLRQHGMDVPSNVRHASPRVIAEEYQLIGYNYRMTDIAAAIGREQLRRFPELVARRRALAARYGELLNALSNVSPPREPSWARSNWQSYPVTLAEHLDQAVVMQRMLDDGVATRRGVICAHREPAYPRASWSCAIRASGCDCPEGTCRNLVASERAQERTILLPLFPRMTDEDQHTVIAALRRACAS